LKEVRSLVSRLDNWKVAITILMFLLILVGVGNLLATYNAIDNFKKAQVDAGQVVEQKLCKTFGKLGDLKPPPGDPINNPSRAFDQKLHETLVELGTDVGCPPRPTAR
jgi:hypothetical protein